MGLDNSISLLRLFSIIFYHIVTYGKENWPSAINETKKILNAWVLNTPMALDGPDLVKFLSMLNSKKVGMVVFRTLLTTTSPIKTSHIIDFPHL